MRTGIGYDIHRFSKNRPLILGGVRIPHHQGLLGHSDADVLCHAVIDALIGAMGEGSIGDFFPDTDKKYKDILRRRRIRHVAARAGDEITGFGGARIFVMNPPKDEAIEDSNDSSMVFKLAGRNVSFLFCGDISARVMKHIMPYGRFLRSGIVKVPHHGGSMGEENTVREFFKSISPEICVISAGGKYSFYNASKNTRELLASLDCNIYETGKNGAIKITTDGLRFRAYQACQKNN